MTLTFSGQVKAGPATLTAGRNFNFWGYCSPKSNGKLGDIMMPLTIEGATESTVSFFTADGAVAQKDFGGTIGVQYENYMYIADDPLDPWVPGGTGWYLMEGDDEHEYPQNERELGAGEGFVFICSPFEIGMRRTRPFKRRTR